MPSVCKALWSFTRTIVGAGSIGFSALTSEASEAACSMAAISSLQPALSRGHTTIGCRNKMSFVDVMCACIKTSGYSNQTRYRDLGTVGTLTVR